MVNIMQRNLGAASLRRGAKCAKIAPKLPIAIRCNRPQNDRR